MAFQKDSSIEVVFSLPGEAQLIRIKGQERNAVARGLLSISKLVLNPDQNDCLYYAEVDTKKVLLKNVPGHCMKSAPKHYAFAEEGSWLGVSLSKNTDAKSIEKLEEVLAKHAGLEMEGEPPPPGGVHTRKTSTGQLVRIAPSWEAVSATTSPYVKGLQKQAVVFGALAAPHVEKAAPHVAYGIGKGGDALAQAIVYGAEKCSTGIVVGGEFIKQKVAPSEKRAEVTEADRIRAQRIKTATDVAAKVSKGVADGFVAMASCFAGAVSDAVGQTEVAKSVRESKSGLKDVATASFEAFGKVFVALEDGTKRVFREAGTVTTDFVRHRHGSDAGALAAEYVQVASNVAESGLALQQVGLETVVTVAAKTTVTDLTKSEELTTQVSQITYEDSEKKLTRQVSQITYEESEKGLTRQVSQITYAESVERGVY